MGSGDSGQNGHDVPGPVMLASATHKDTVITLRKLLHHSILLMLRTAPIFETLETSLAFS